MNINILASLLIASVFHVSCQEIEDPNQSEPVFLEDQKITINGLEREYHLQVPKESSNKPIVVLLHGHSGSHDQSLGMENTKAPQKVWLEVAQAKDFIVVVPNGTLGPEDSRGWNDCRDDAKGNPETDDLAFISQMLDKILGEYNYDESRVYVAGVSNGAGMAIRLAQEIPEKITAFASVITTMAANSECFNSDVPISALFMNGTADPLAPYEGGDVSGERGEVISTQASIDYWLDRNETNITPIETFLDDVDTNDQSNIVKYLYKGGKNGTEVVLYKVVGGGHTEPSIAERYGNLFKIIVGEQNADIEMAEEVWNFFSTKSK